MRFDELTDRIQHTTALRLLPKLLLALDTTTWRRLDQRALGELLDRNQATISRAISALITAGALHRSGAGPGVRYRLSHHVDWPTTPEPTDLSGREVMRPALPRFVSGVDSIRSDPEAEPPSPPPPARRGPARPRSYAEAAAALRRAKERAEDELVALAASNRASRGAALDAARAALELVQRAAADSARLRAARARQMVRVR